MVKFGIIFIHGVTKAIWPGKIGGKLGTKGTSLTYSFVFLVIALEMADDNRQWSGLPVRSRK